MRSHVEGLEVTVRALESNSPLQFEKKVPDKLGIEALEQVLATSRFSTNLNKDKRWKIGAHL